MASTVDRRRFVQVGATGLGASLLSGNLGAAPLVQDPAILAAPRQVRMSGDGLGLTALEQGRLLTGLADAGRIARDSYSNGGTVTQLEEACATLLGKERAVFMPTGTLANHLAVRALAGLAATQSMAATAERQQLRGSSRMRRSRRFRYIWAAMAHTR